MNKWYRIAFATVALLVAVAFGILTRPSTAHAGTNGQQLEIRTSAVFGCVDYGTNQNGTFVQNSPQTPLCWYLPDLPIDSNNNAHQIPGWWWQGGLSFSVYDAQGNFITGSCYNIPVSQPSDWYTITLAP